MSDLWRDEDGAKDAEQDRKERIASLKVAVKAVERGRAPGVAPIRRPARQQGRPYTKTQLENRHRKAAGLRAIHDTQSGRPVHPNTLRALEMHRHKGQWHNLPKCVVCGRACLSGSDKCIRHDLREWARRLRMDPAYRPKKTTLIRKQVMRMIASGTLPKGLAEQPAFIEAWRRIRLSHVELLDVVTNNGQTSVGAYRRDTCIFVAELMAAWVMFEEHGDAAPYAQCMIRARELRLV